MVLAIITICIILSIHGILTSILSMNDAFIFFVKIFWVCFHQNACHSENAFYQFRISRNVTNKSNTENQKWQVSKISEHLTQSCIFKSGFLCGITQTNIGINLDFITFYVLNFPPIISVEFIAGQDNFYNCILSLIKPNLCQNLYVQGYPPLTDTFNVSVMSRAKQACGSRSNSKELRFLLKGWSICSKLKFN